jgi:hypothetical protein
MCVLCIAVVSVAAVAVSLTTTSCSRKDSNKPNVGEISKLDLPSWVINPYEGLGEGVIAGVGMSKTQREHDEMRFLIQQAESAARAEIATTIQTEISRVIKDATHSATVENMNAVESSFSSVTKEVVRNVPLSGAVRDKIYLDKNKVLYIRVVINESVVKNYLKSRVSDYVKAMEDARKMENANISRSMINQTEASMKKLFDEMEVRPEELKSETKN